MKAQQQKSIIQINSGVVCTRVCNYLLQEQHKNLICNQNDAISQMFYSDFLADSNLWCFAGFFVIK